MGERFLLCRMAQNDDLKEAAAIHRSMGREQEMRDELAAAVKFLFETIVIPVVPPSATEEEKDRVSALAALAVRCRSAVERDSYRRDIISVPQSERPGRMMRSLMKLLAGFKVLEVDGEVAFAALARVAFDSMPAARRYGFDALARSATPMGMSAIVQEAGCPETVVRRGLEELQAHHIVTRQSGGGGKADIWELSPWTVRQVLTAGVVFPESRGSRR